MVPRKETGTCLPNSKSGIFAFVIENSPSAKKLPEVVLQPTFRRREQHTNDTDIEESFTQGLHQLRCRPNPLPTTATESAVPVVLDAIVLFQPPKADRGQLNVAHASPMFFDFFWPTRGDDARQLLGGPRANYLLSAIKTVGSESVQKALSDSGTVELREDGKNESPRRIFEQPPPEHSRNPNEVSLSNLADRKWLSPSALRAFFEIMEIWKIHDDAARKLIGGLTTRDFFALKRDSESTLDEDKLRRIASLLEIVAALNAIYGDTELATKWIRTANKNPLFGGKAPLEYLIRGDLLSFKKVEGFLNAY